jgi:pyruvate,water dikinase
MEERAIAASYDGLGAAPGRARGHAHVLRDASDEAHVPAGAIVVARIIHPHLAPLFFEIGGIVVEEGALLQHATTLARELGVPAIVGLKGATATFTTGDVLAIDGTTGLVVRESA